MRFIVFFLLGLLAGSMITIQSVLNSVLGKRIENFGAVLVLTIVSISVLLVLILFFPSTANLRKMPGLSEWYLYLGGVLGVVILAAPIFLIPKIGATSTLTALVMGQLGLALLIDHFGPFGFPKIDINWLRLIGVLLVVVGAVFIGKR
jgi:transporter family-2 protein